jgi:iron(III) transport system substrate-binding protein
MSRAFVFRFLGVGVLLAVAGCGGPADGSKRVVLYCAQDREFAEEILKEFTRRTGVEVAVSYDTEANKSVSLYETLVREASRPRCDVHWNNEILGTIRLEKKGLLEPYDSPVGKYYPPAFKAGNGAWYAFAARARVIVVNTHKVPVAERPRGWMDLTQPRWRGQVAMAKPQFGTSATQAACLFQAWGADKARDFYRALHRNEVQLVPGNKQVAEGVGQGQFALGLTDTDDAIAEIEAHHPVALIYPDRDASPENRLGTLFIPNTLAMIRGCPNPAGAHQLIDYLLSTEVEELLANSASHQIPLNSRAQGKLPPEIETPRTVHALPVDFSRAADCWEEAQRFLVEEFAR